MADSEAPVLVIALRTSVAWTIQFVLSVLLLAGVVWIVPFLEFELPPEYLFPLVAYLGFSLGFVFGLGAALGARYSLAESTFPILASSLAVVSAPLGLLVYISLGEEPAGLGREATLTLMFLGALFGSLYAGLGFAAYFEAARERETSLD